MSETGAFGRRLADRFGLESAPTLVTRTLRKTQIAVTQIKCDVPSYKPTSSIPYEDAFLVALQLRDLPVHEYWEGGRQAPVTSLKTGDTTLYDLKRDPVFLMNNPFHSIHFYLPRAVFNAIADDANARRIGGLAYRPGAGVEDLVMRGLATAVLPAFEHPDQASRLLVEHVTLAVAAHVAHTYGGMRATARSVRGGLAPWQEHRAKEIISSNLDGEISLAWLSKECGLSTSHFSRSFKQSTGISPHQWLLDRRVEMAKDLLRGSRLSLTDIALACGFSDQSHFTRVFVRACGVSPGVWRRGNSRFQR